MPDLPRPARLSLHHAIGYVAEYCKCDPVKAGNAVFYALGEGSLVATANALISPSYLPGVYVDPAPLRRRIDAGIHPIPARLWATNPEAWRRAVHPHGNQRYREHRADGGGTGPEYVNPTLATADIDKWLDGEVHQNSAGAKDKRRRGPKAGTIATEQQIGCCSPRWNAYARNLR